eukprot:CAMPEP_0170564034 /NCGR_PEP_ID=MMETSP0211-20121228/70433_1 /TAXON_ID=311385 /ORGANISM="Pseudokeronopsis sp., Strain OXSARD2" /LENGTH=88 /DNA_ID=CAMNT_0010882983 /DNA_START=446 /DNA_END=712 /DNA_ORIENTATION=+
MRLDDLIDLPTDHSEEALLSLQAEHELGLEVREPCAAVQLLQVQYHHPSPGEPLHHFLQIFILLPKGLKSEQGMPKSSIELLLTTRFK